MSDLDCQFGDLPVGLRKILLSMLHGLAPSPAVLLTIPNGQPVFLLSGVTLLSLHRPYGSSHFIFCSPSEWTYEQRGSLSLISFDEGQRPSHGPRCGHQYDRGCEHQTQQTE